MASDDCLSASLIRLIASLIRLIDCLSASLIRWRSPRGTPRACALGTAARQAHDHATCVPAQRRTCGLGAQAAHTGRDAPSDRAAGGRAQEQGRSQDVPSARHPSVKRRRPDQTAPTIPPTCISPPGGVKRRRPDQTAPTIPPTCISPQGGLFSRHGGHDPYPLVNGDDLRIQEKSVRGRFLILFGFCICGVGLNRAACGAGVIHMRGGSSSDLGSERAPPRPSEAPGGGRPIAWAFGCSAV